MTLSSHSPISVSLRRMFQSASFVGCADIYVTEATAESRSCGPNHLFAAIPGTKVNGTEFIDEAVRHGATSLLVQRPIANVALPQCVVPNVRKSYAELCAAIAGDPTSHLDVVGVTGTNGKTTVTWLVRSILNAAGRRTGVLGTIEYDDGVHTERSKLTTPDAKTFCRWLESMLRRGTTHAAVELSSHALDQQRVAGSQLAAAVVTNITQDHFDYHNGFQAYQLAKARILDLCRPGALVALNADDPGSMILRESIREPLKLTTYGLEHSADVTATVLQESHMGSRFLMNLGGEDRTVWTSLVGRHNVSNCLAAAACVQHLGLPLDDIVDGIETLDCVPGRLERIECGQPYELYVDYAHTEDALRRSVSHLSRLTSGRVICVFGAGGDRDRSKRPRMGKAASAADLVVVTSDNPRSENPHQIISDILAGFDWSRTKPYVEADRADAICWALGQAEAGDCVLVAGKGHETEQIIGDDRIPFDDREVIREALRISAVAQPNWLQRQQVRATAAVPQP